MRTPLCVKVTDSALRVLMRYRWPDKIGTQMVVNGQDSYPDSNPDRLGPSKESFRVF